MSSSSARPSDGRGTAAPVTPPPAVGTVADGYVVTVDGTDHRFVVPPGEPILDAARRAGVWLPFECGWGSCGTCKVTVLDGGVRLLFPGAPAVDARDARRSRSITCQATPTSDLRLRVSRLGPAPERPTRDHTGTLTGVEPVGAGIHRFTFRLDAPARYRPGQYAVLELGPRLRRCYSMTGLPGEDVTFLAKHHAGRAGSEALLALPLGAQVPMALPFGDLWLRPERGRDVLVAGGTGIAPVLALLEQLAQEASLRPLLVLYGAATLEELACWADLGALVGRLPGAEVVGVLTRPPRGWAGASGTVTAPLSERGDAEDCYYLAGPPAMMDVALAVLRDKQVPLDRIHFDRFG